MAEGGGGGWLFPVFPPGFLASFPSLHPPGSSPQAPGVGVPGGGEACCCCSGLGHGSRPEAVLG